MEQSTDVCISLIQSDTEVFAENDTGQSSGFTPVWKT